jgi:hypothetical protein
LLLKRAQPRLNALALFGRAARDRTQQYQSALTFFMI